jgi:hypothetical protein
VAPSIAPSLGKASWQEIGSLQGIAQEYARAIVGYAGGYVALVDQLPGGPPTVRTSSDGRSWRTVPLAAPDPIDPPGADTQYDSPASPVALASDGTTVIVVGSYYHEPCDWSRLGDTGGGPACPSSPISWITTDGLDWRSSLPWSDACRPADDSFSPGCAFSAVWAVPDGWETGMFYVGGEAGQQRETWHSGDGLTWERRADLVDEDAAPVAAVGFDGRRIVALPCYGDCSGGVTLWTSEDGFAWIQSSAPQDAVGVDTAIGPQLAGEPWVLAGRGSKRATAVWTSADLRSWQEAVLPGAPPDVPWQLAASARSAAGYVVVAWGLWNESNPYRATWLSHDARTWQALDDPPLVQVVAEGPAGVIGLGYGGEDGVMPVYLLR